jgi:hypothetical protein
MRDTYTIADVASIVEGEGLGYAIQHYLNPDKIEDEHLRQIWEEAYILLSEIDEILSPYYE